MTAVDVAARNPERDAQDVLEAVWIRDEDGIVVPVNPIAIAKDLGIQVFVAELEDDVSGMLVKEPDSAAAIYLNRQNSDTRQRFTCAHEIGHSLRRAAVGDDDWSYVDLRSPLSSTGEDGEERYANRFAASLLMPRTEVTRLAERHGPAMLAYRFGVSSEAMSFRLNTLRLW